MKPLADIAGNWPAVNRLLDEALDLPPEQRADWLAALPAEHEPLRQTLTRLLALQSGIETDAFLGTLPRLAPLAPGLPGTGDAAAGDVVGPWRLIREIGSGGMGSVWLAERADGSLKRQVALKRPKLSWADGLAERMARERDILASLEHPNIARLYDAGVDERGRPWLALEFVQGQPLDVHARSRGLSLRARVEMLLQVCAAVAYAHSRLVIHRDLKPGNILVTDDGRIKLLDFGIARLVQGDPGGPAAALTDVAGRAMTPDYASPEQVRGDALGTASDIYSLGVVAYELLAGTRPYRLKRGSTAELEEAIERADIVPASRAATADADRRGLRGDLDAILAQAMRRRPDQRYPTVETLAQDLRRHLDGRAVLAVPDRLGYRAGRLLRRHWVPVGAAALVSLALVIGTAVALWQAGEAREASLRARQEAAVSQAVQGFLESVFLANSGDQSRPDAARELSARDLLDRGARRIEVELRDSPRARLRMLQVMGGMYEDLNQFDRMRGLYEMRLAQARAIDGVQGGSDTVLALADLAHAFAISGREADARALLDEADAMLEKHPRLDAAAALRVALRRASVHRADDPPRAARAAEKALALARTMPVSGDLLLALYLVSENLAATPEAARAAPLLAEAIGLAERRPELGASVLAPLLVLQSDVQSSLAQVDAAEASLRRAVEVERERGNQGVTPHFVTLKLGMFLYDQGRWRESLDALAPSYDWARGQERDFETTVPMVSAAYGRSLVAWGRLAEGIAALDRAALQAAQLQDAPDLVPRIELLRASASIEQGRMTDVDRSLRAAEQVIVDRSTGQERHLAAVRRELMLAHGQGAAALAQWREERRAGGLDAVPAATETAAVHAEAARLHLAAGLAEPARAMAAQALASAGADTPRTASLQVAASRCLGLSLLALGRPQEAVAALERAASLHRGIVDDRHSLDFADTVTALAEARRRAGQTANAASARAEAQGIRSRHTQRPGPRWIDAVLKRPTAG